MLFSLECFLIVPLPCEGDDQKAHSGDEEVGTADTRSLRDGFQFEMRGITVDNGSEFTCRVMDAWAYQVGIELYFIDPGKPVLNAFAESFNSRLREECLNQHQFAGLVEARTLIEAFCRDYKSLRPHTSLGGLSPEQFIFGLTGAMAPVKPDHATQSQHDLTLPDEAPRLVGLP